VRRDELAEDPADVVLGVAHDLEVLRRERRHRGGAVGHGPGRRVMTECSSFTRKLSVWRMRPVLMRSAPTSDAGGPISSARAKHIRPRPPKVVSGLYARSRWTTCRKIAKPSRYERSFEKLPSGRARYSMSTSEIVML